MIRRCKITMMVLLLVFGFCLAIAATTVYTREARVDRVEGLTVYLVDTTGHEWVLVDCYAEEGEEVKLLMHTNNTEDVFTDDYIVSIKFKD